MSKYNDKTVLDNEDDSVLVARIIEKTIFNRLIQIIENVYDPYSTKQTINLTSLISYLFKIYSTISSSQSAQVGLLKFNAYFYFILDFIFVY